MLPKYKLRDKVIVWVCPDTRVDIDDVVAESEIEKIQYTTEKTESADMDENYNDTSTTSEQCTIKYAIRDGIDEFWVSEDQLCDSYSEAYEEVLRYLDNQIDKTNQRLSKLKTLKLNYEDRLLKSLENK